MNARPPLDAAQLAETIDTIGLLVASLSDRVDAQGRILEKVHQTATEARAAAFAAERATDWKRNAASINSSLERALVSPMARFREADGLLRKSEEFLRETVKLLETARLREEQHRYQRKQLWRRRMPWLFAGAVLGGFVLAFAVLHLVGGAELFCALLGGRYGVFGDGAGYCAFRP